MWKLIENPPVTHDFRSEPRIACKDGKRYLFSEGVDLTPAYGHERTAVDAGIAMCDKVLQPPLTIHLALCDKEFLSRTNGWSTTTYLQEGDKIWQGVIVLSGKRIPPHPAMTRYLVVHEFGHHVEFLADRVLFGEKGPSSKTREEYRRIREVPEVSYYGPGQWHASVGEVFANDFRILVAGCETEFWPHAGIPYPSGEVARKLEKFFWQPAMDELRSYKL